MSKEISQQRDKRLDNMRWRERTGFDNIMTPGDLRERKRRERVIAIKDALGLSE